MHAHADQYLTPEPFKIEVPQHRLDELDERLRRWRPPTEIDNAGWAYGTAPALLRELVDHWRHAYDWLRCEDLLNSFPNYLVDIGSQRIHFIREPGTSTGEGPPPLPLIVSHGWPGSVVEFLDVIDQLAHPERHGGDAIDAFDVIVPSLPGYGWSGPPVRRDGSIGPIGPRDVASYFHQLVHGSLNYDRAYVAQGGDWGAVISSWLAFDHPLEELKDGGQHGCRALHLNMVGLRPGIDMRATKFTSEEEAWLKSARGVRETETAYQDIQATKPQTLAVALTDSPVGLAAWILEKFHGWTDGGEAAIERIGFDRILDNIMVYWATGTAGTATWMYRGVREQPDRGLPPGARVEVPTGFAAFPKDLSPPPPRSWVERAYNLRSYTAMPHGGHFAAMEAPELWLRDIRDFCRPLRFGAVND